MTKPLLTLVLLSFLCAPAAAAPEASVNLALFEFGGMPAALSLAPSLTFSAQKAADGRSDTGWVSGGGFPVWLEVAWRFPVEVREVALRQFPACPVKEVGPIGRYALEAHLDGKWQEVGSGDASGTPLDGEVRLRLAQPVTTMAVRLVFHPSAAAQVAVSELQVLGPRPVLPFQWAPTWQARYIWTEPSLVVAQRQPVRRYFRRAFSLEDPGSVREAWLLATAFDRLNGLWLNNRLLMKQGSLNGGLRRRPGIERVPLDLLTKGENVLAASVDDIYEVGSHGLLAELILVHRDGTRTVIATDASWRGQEDQGEVPTWRKPGFKETRWVACTPVTAPTAGWHALWGVPYPVVAPQETLRVMALNVQPVGGEVGRALKPGDQARCRVTFECASKPTADYAVAVRLGQHSFVANHDYELWGAALPPEAVKTSAWDPGRHTVELTLRIPEEAPAPTPATLLVSLPTAGAGLETALPGCRADAYGLHFTLPVDRGVKPPAAAKGFTRNEVRTVRGTPMLHIDGRPVSPIFWSSSYGNYRRYSEYAATGVKLFRPLIDGSPICAPGEEADYYPWWFEQIDRMIEAALSVDPEIRVLPALFMDPSPEVLFDDPSEQMTTGRGTVTIPFLLSRPDIAQVRPTFMSHAWRRLGAEGIRRLVEHMKAQPYAPNVVGLWFFAGRGGENYYGGNELNLFINEKGQYDAKPREQWDAGEFSSAGRRVFRKFLVRKYGSDEALQKAWLRPGIRLDDILSPARFPREEVCDILVGARKTPEAGSLRDPLEPGVGSLPMDYHQCYAEAMVDTFAEWGRAVKEASEGRLLAGCYYGYTLAQLITNVPGYHGHTAVARAFETPHLDFYCSPSLYETDTRRAGGAFWGYNIVDSLRLHNKLWIYEQDTRTFLSEIPPKSYSREETLAVLKRDCAAALTHGAGWWWYEFPEGQRGGRSREWFIDPEIASFAGHIKRVYDHALTLPDRGPAAEIALFYHGETHTAQEIHPPTVPLNVSIGRLTLFDGVQRIGAPYDLYNLADIPELSRTGRLDQYKLCLFLNPFYLTAAERQSLELCKGGGRTLVWLWAPGLAQAGEKLSPERVSAVTGIPGIRWRQGVAEPTCRLTPAGHLALKGIADGTELSPRPFAPGDVWARFGNIIGPVLFVDPAAAAPETKLLGRWVLDGKPREEMGAFAVREVLQGGKRQWASVYSAVPYLSPEVMRALARYAGVHVYRDADDVLYADRHFVAIHTGAKPATGTLRLPRKTPVYDVVARKTVAQSADAVTLDVPPYSTVLYYLGDPAILRAAVEKPL